jgi:DNA-binding response OmpR family regulator
MNGDSARSRVLVVDDQTPMAMMMVFLLTREGYEVTAARNGLKGFDHATETKFDLIVLEADLPDMNGFDICRELRQRHICRHTAIVLVSRNHSVEDCQRAFDLGADDFIEKPFNASEFVSRIASVLEESTLA